MHFRTEAVHESKNRESTPSWLEESALRDVQYVMTA